MMEEAAKPVWLAQVREMEPLFAFARGHPVMGAWISAFPVAALVATLALVREREIRRDAGFLLAAGAFLLAFAATLTVVKAYSYAMWLGMPLLAAQAARWTARATPRLAAIQAVAVLALTPLGLSAAAITLANAAIVNPPADHPARAACFETASYEAMARLPAGLVAAEVDDGPFILALTPHAVLAAPYHRLSAALLTAHEVFARPPAEAREILSRLGVTYVAICGRPDEGAREGSLRVRLQAGEVPAWLSRVPGPEGSAFAIYRVEF
jgi:hypothetical protein